MPEHKDHRENIFSAILKRTLKRQLRRGLDVADAEDTTHDAIVTTLQANITTEKDHALAAYTDTTARRKLLDLARRKKMMNRRHVRISDDELFHLASNESAEKSAMKRLTVRRTMDAIAQLPPDYRQVFELLSQGYSNEEIAEMTNIKPVTIRTRISKGRKKLQEILKD